MARAIPAVALLCLLLAASVSFAAAAPATHRFRDELEKLRTAEPANVLTPHEVYVTGYKVNPPK